MATTSEAKTTKNWTTDEADALARRINAGAGRYRATVCALPNVPEVGISLQDGVSSPLPILTDPARYLDGIHDGRIPAKCPRLVLALSEHDARRKALDAEQSRCTFLKNRAIELRAESLRLHRLAHSRWRGADRLDRLAEACERNIEAFSEFASPSDRADFLREYARTAVERACQTLALTHLLKEQQSRIQSAARRFFTWSQAGPAASFGSGAESDNA